MNNKLKSLAYTGIFLALALIIGVVEQLIPPFFPLVPFAKVGFSNIVILTALLTLGKKPAILITALKCILVPLFVGNPVMILYSFPASAISITITILLINTNKLGIPAISIISALSNTFIQICVASLMASTTLVFGYTPYLFVIASFSGFAIGIITQLLYKKMPDKLSIIEK